MLVMCQSDMDSPAKPRVMRYFAGTRETRNPTSGIMAMVVKPPGESTIPARSAL